MAGHDVHRHPKAARGHLGVCLQDETLDTDLCVVDQLLGHTAYFRIPRAVALPRALALLARNAPRLRWIGCPAACGACCRWRVH